MSNEVTEDAGLASPPPPPTFLRVGHVGMRDEHGLVIHFLPGTFLDAMRSY